MLNSIANIQLYSVYGDAKSCKPTKNRRLDNYKEHDQEQAASKGISCQLSLEESSEHGQLWDINDPCAQCIHCRIGKMISADCQPFSTVQDVHLLVEVKYSYQLLVLTDIFRQ